MNDRADGQGSADMGSMDWLSGAASAAALKALGVATLLEPAVDDPETASREDLPESLRKLWGEDPGSISTRDWLAHVTGLLGDGVPRTLNRLALEILDKRGSDLPGTLVGAVGRLAAGGFLEHTAARPVLFRLGVPRAAVAAGERSYGWLLAHGYLKAEALGESVEWEVADGPEGLRRIHEGGIASSRNWRIRVAIRELRSARKAVVVRDPVVLWALGGYRGPVPEASEADRGHWLYRTSGAVLARLRERWRWRLEQALRALLEQRARLRRNKGRQMTFEQWKKSMEQAAEDARLPLSSLVLTLDQYEVACQKRGALPRGGPDGRVNNCALAVGCSEGDCQMCGGACPDRDCLSARAVCPRCLGIEPGKPAGSPVDPHPGPFTGVLCDPCEADNAARLRAERGMTVEAYARASGLGAPKEAPRDEGGNLEGCTIIAGGVAADCGVCGGRCPDAARLFREMSRPKLAATAVWADGDGADGARHSAETVEHLSPFNVVGAATLALGGSIDLDPASCATANDYIEAERYFDATMNGLSREWGGRVFLNPPGGVVDVTGRAVYPRTKKRESCLVTGACGLAPGHRHEGPLRSSGATWWFKLAREWTAGRLEAAVFLGFTVELLCSTQTEADGREGLLLPLDCVLCLPAARLRFLRVAADGSLEPGESPPHASFLAYLGPYPSRFEEAFAPIGRVLRGHELARSCSPGARDLREGK